MPFNAIRENKILTKISESSVYVVLRLTFYILQVCMHNDYVFLALFSEMAFSIGFG